MRGRSYVGEFSTKKKEDFREKMSVFGTKKQGLGRGKTIAFGMSFWKLSLTLWDLFIDTGSQNNSPLHSARMIFIRLRVIFYLFYSTLPSSARVINCRIIFGLNLKEKLLKV